ncbi:MAG TPA: PP2C family protein-serine/threonine phosphatase [Thermoanaerobaculia bacterium]|nr:PP2C family protein-serine/threonine phosphatase [Thermoanaerobaculia bacterium]
MRAPTLDELVLLPEPLALQRHFDAKNDRVLRGLVLFLALMSLGGIAGGLESGKPFAAAVYVVNLLVNLGVFALRGRDLYVRSARQILLVYLLAEILVLKFTSTLMGGESIPLFIMTAFLLLAFRLRLSEHLLLYGAFWVAAVFPPAWLGLSADAGLAQGDLIAVTVISVICLSLAVLFSQLDRRRFLTGWRREHSRYRERIRMREEIEYARKIQLSMLPQGAPEVAWLDLAAASLPATEVGGDYYDYFLLGPRQIALVVADVAGHGLASGLLLSGVRSCLYLLEEDMVSPVAILERLNHMVRRTTDRRTYVTLLCAVIDWDARTLTVASAGHPPVLRYDAKAHDFEEVGRGAPPLGTFLDVRYEEVRSPLAPGDLLVFYSDGIIEARGSLDKDYGDARLKRAVARAANSRTAREVRDAVLGDLSNFKADQEQADDITLVVLRLKELPLSG